MVECERRLREDTIIQIAGRIFESPGDPGLFALAENRRMTPAPIKPLLPYAALEALDIRVGTIRNIEAVPKSDRLLRLTVDFGDHTRTILSGIKQERPDPRALVGRQALFVVNLAPRKMMGEISEGMLFDLGFADGLTPALAVPERPVPDGTRAG
jgi:tRNA-binding protein